MNQFLKIGKIIFVILLTLSFVFSQKAEAQCTGPTIVYTPTVPTLTGFPDASWNGAPINAISKYVPGTGSGSQLQSDYAAQWRAMFDVNNLYVLVEVKDAALYPAPTGTSSPWMYDAVEIYIDGNNTKTTSYGSTDHQFGFTYGTSTSHTILYGGNDNSSLQFAMPPTAWPGYNLVVTIPWTVIGITAPSSSGNISIGFDINIQDNDNGSNQRVATSAWNTTSSQEFNDPALFGTANLAMCTIGTLNYVAKFTSPTTLGKSLIYDNGTFVGIGTTTASTAMLNVNGIVKSTGIQLTTSPGIGKVLTSDSAGNGSWLAVDLSSGWKLAGNSNADANSFIGTTTAQPIVFKTNNTEGFRIAANGNVTVGTYATAPASKLAVNGTMSIGSDGYIPAGYMLAVNGSLLATEVVVKLRTKWPDYVFSKEYKLMSLGEVEQYIKQHKHLPGLPAASEVETQGMKVGEVNVMMVEKIEQLTLHAIEQQKTITSLLKLIEEQNSRLEKLEKK